MPKAALVDIDDTLANIQVHMLDYINRHVESAYEWHQLTRDFRENDSDPLYASLVKEFLNRPQLVRQVEPFPFAEAALAQLNSAGYQLHIVSSRKESLHETTRLWLEDHGLARYIEAIHPRFSHQRGHEFKVDTSRKIKAEVAFDDTFQVAHALAGAGVWTYLIDKPWNREEALPGSVVRVKDLEEAVRQYCSYQP